MQIKVKVLEHKGSDLLLAISDDLKGLYAHGRSMDDLDRIIPIAIQELLEANTGKVHLVTCQRDGEPFNEMGVVSYTAVAA